MLISTLYVSRSLIDPAHANATVADLVEASIANNRRRDITGSLLFTGAHFAQLLEGPEGCVGALMTSIGRDIRHERLTVIDHSPISERKFRDWALGYSGPSLFIERHVARVLASPPDADQRRMARWLAEAMQQLMVA